MECFNKIKNSTISLKMLNSKRVVIYSVILISTVFLNGCGKSDKAEIGDNKIAATQSSDNELTSSVKSEMVSSNDGQKFYDIGACMALASKVYGEEIHKNDEELKSIIRNRLLQLNKSIDFISIGKHVTFVTTQKCGDINSQPEESYNKCAASNFSDGLKGYIQGTAAPQRLISNGQLSHEDIFAQFNVYCERFF
jgi:hypothetical protein